ncbi:MAG TPA: hypothetical protein DHW70_02225 [Candidatus Atribacteria bacterium]|nr:hypothetical protein [Candidatus Atribacteria bacterium]
MPTLISSGILGSISPLTNCDGGATLSGNNAAGNGIIEIKIIIRIIRTKSDISIYIYSFFVHFSSLFYFYMDI